MDITVIVASVAVFLTITFILVGMLLGAKAKLLPSGPVNLQINGENDVEVDSGSTLLTTLGNNKIFLPSACGGGELVSSASAKFLKVVEKFYLQRPHTSHVKKLLKDGVWDAK